MRPLYSVRNRVIIFSQESFHPTHIAIVISCSLIVAFLSCIALSVAEPVSRMMSRTAINIITRLMGLLIAAISVEFITGGLLQLIPALSK